MMDEPMFRRDKENEPTPPDEDGWPRQSDLRRWRQRLASERAEAAIYRDLAQRRTGEERDILLALAAAEGRHEQHWLNLLGDQVGKPCRGDMPTACWVFWLVTWGRCSCSP